MGSRPVAKEIRTSGEMNLNFGHCLALQYMYRPRFLPAVVAKSREDIQCFLWNTLRAGACVLEPHWTVLYRQLAITLHK